VSRSHDNSGPSSVQQQQQQQQRSSVRAVPAAFFDSSEPSPVLQRQQQQQRSSVATPSGHGHKKSVSFDAAAGASIARSAMNRYI
jgi:hypothetical protein